MHIDQIIQQSPLAIPRLPNAEHLPPDLAKQIDGFNDEIESIRHEEQNDKNNAKLSIGTVSPGTIIEFLQGLSDRRVKRLARILQLCDRVRSLVELARQEDASELARRKQAAIEAKATAEKKAAKLLKPGTGAYAAYVAEDEGFMQAENELRGFSPCIRREWNAAPYREASDKLLDKLQGEASKAIGQAIL